LLHLSHFFLSFLFSRSIFLWFYNLTKKSFPILLYLQATGGPVNTAIMGNWFPKKGRGLVFGLWTCHQYSGDIVAAFAGAAILNSALNW